MPDDISKMLLCCCVSFLLFLVGCCTPSNPPQAAIHPTTKPSDSVPITISTQQMTNWCWAACGQMAMSHWGVNVEQCTELTKAYACQWPAGVNPDVCANWKTAKNADGSSPYDYTGWPRLDQFDFVTDSQSECVQPSLSFEEIKTQIALGQPVLTSIHWDSSNSGHMLIIVGYDTAGGAEKVAIVDPETGRGDQWLWSQLQKGVLYNYAYSHWRDFYNIRPKANH